MNSTINSILTTRFTGERITACENSEAQAENLKKEKNEVQKEGAAHEDTREYDGRGSACTPGENN